MLGLSVMAFGKQSEKKAVPQSNIIDIEQQPIAKKVDHRVRQTEISNIVNRLTNGSGNTDEDIENLLEILRVSCKNSPNELSAIMQNIKKSVLLSVRYYEKVSSRFHRFEEACNVFILSLLAHFKARSYDEEALIEFQKELEKDPITIDLVFNQETCQLKKMPESWAITVECRLDDFKKLTDVFNPDDNGNLIVNIGYVEKVTNIFGEIHINGKNKARLLKAVLFEIGEHVLTSALQEELSQGKIGHALEKFKKEFISEFIKPLQDFADGLSFIKQNVYK